MTEQPSEKDLPLFRLAESAALFPHVKDTHAGVMQQKTPQEELLFPKAFLDIIIENSPYSLWVSDHQGTMIRMNQACRDLLRVTDEDLVGKYNVFKDNIVQEQGAIPLIRQVFEQGERVRFILRYDSSRLKSLTLPETTDVVLEVTISPFLNQQKQVTYAIVQHIDITERIRAEESLRRSEERFKRLLQNTNDIITVVDKNGVHLSVNGPLEEVFGYQPAEFIGKISFDFFHPDDVKETLKILAKAIKKPGTVRRAECRLRHKDGTWKMVEIVVNNLLHDPIVQGIIGNIRDISERKQDEEERNKLKGQLQQAMKMEAVGRLAGGVAHDFNNLLTVISGNVDLMKLKLKPSDPLLHYLNTILKAAESAASLTSRLLAFSRRQIIEPKVLNLNDLIRNLMKMLNRLIGEDINLQAALGKNLGSVKVDPGQFEQVLVNLAVNARDAMPQGGQLVIETANVDLDEEYCAHHPHTQPGNFVLLAISDTGCGMSQEVKQHLFEPFFTTKARGQGTGLGLATTFGAVKQVGGSIEVYSELGQGTSFKIYLPRVDGPAEQLVQEKPDFEMPQGKETVLLVEDDANVRELALAILKRLGYKALSASNGGEAFLLVEKHKGPIDLLLTDVVMPGMNGRELAERLVQFQPKMKVLFTSGYTENIIVHHGIVEENLNFIGKPYTMQALAKKVREVLDQAQKNQS